MLKNKTTQIIIAVVVVVILIGGGYFFFINKSSTKLVTQNQAQTDKGPENLAPSDIGLVFKASSNKKQVKFSVDKLTDIKAISYQINYEADTSAQEISEGAEPRVARGFIGEAKINSGDSSYESPWIDLGSASKNVVRYDSGVKSVDLILKIIKANGKVYQTEKNLSL